MTALYTWRDVERALQRVQSPPWVRIATDLESLVITCAAEHRANAQARLEECFGHALGPDHLALESSIGVSRRLELRWEDPEDGEEERLRPPVRPLWPYAFDEPTNIPPLEAEAPRLLAFYSYKGGVGRTTALLAMMGALLAGDKSERVPPARVLLVDADLEAPGLTWNVAGPPGRFSLLDLLALVHDHDDWRKDALPLAAERLQQSTAPVELPSGRSHFFFLPAYRDDDQLFAPPITFEQVVRARGRSNIIAELLASLGDLLEVDAVLVDLRAGVTEISSPLLLDPRVQTILVTSCGQQSVEGTLRVLDRMKTRARPETGPEVLLNLVPVTFTDAQTDEIKERLLAGVPASADDDPAEVLARPPVHSAEFSESLFHYDSLDELLERIPGTQLGTRAAELGRQLVQRDSEEEPASMPEVGATEGPRPGGMLAIAREAGRLEFAESNARQGLLPTPALEALVDQSTGGMPTAVVLGAKGAGKTYAWGQMVIAGEWEGFARDVSASRKSTPKVLPARVFPLLGPENVDAGLASKVQSAERSVWSALGLERGALSGDELRARLSNQDFEGDELSFWVWAIAARLGLPTDEIRNIETLVSLLEDADTPVLLAIDGLEDSFQPGPRSPLTPEQQRVLRGLLQRFTTQVRDLRSRHLGVVTFIRRDLAESAIPQNFGQFEKLHQRFALSWSPTEALRLVAWVLQHAGRDVTDPARIAVASYDELRVGLQSFWGERLGSKKSKEAYTDRWVIAALSDFQARLQPRDVVRLVRYAAEVVPDEQTRLTPASLRVALEKCSVDKIAELEREIPKIVDIFDHLRRAAPERKRIPFRAEEFGLTPADVSFLETQGLVLRDAQGELFFPEIIRLGLDFKMDRGRRPPVLAMYRRATQGRPS